MSEVLYSAGEYKWTDLDHGHSAAVMAVWGEYFSEANPRRRHAVGVWNYPDTHIDWDMAEHKLNWRIPDKIKSEVEEYVASFKPNPRFEAKPTETVI